MDTSHLFRYCMGRNNLQTRQYMAIELTDRQRAILDFIGTTVQERNYPPTIREICEHMGIRSTNGVNDHLKALEKKGYLTREGQKSRTLRLAASHGKIVEQPPGLPTAGHGDAIPLVGQIAAGSPITAEEHIEDYIPVSPDLFKSHGCSLFALRVRGASMIQDGILDGDLIFVRQQETARPGEIIAALLDDEATVKRYYPEASGIRLQPANDAMEPIWVNKLDRRTFSILGKVVGVLRKYAQA